MEGFDGPGWEAEGPQLLSPMRTKSSGYPHLLQSLMGEVVHWQMRMGSVIAGCLLQQWLTDSKTWFFWQQLS